MIGHNCLREENQSSRSMASKLGILSPQLGRGEKEGRCGGKIQMGDERKRETESIRTEWKKQKQKQNVLGMWSGEVSDPPARKSLKTTNLEPPPSGMLLCHFSLNKWLTPSAKRLLWLHFRQCCKCPSHVMRRSISGLHAYSIELVEAASSGGRTRGLQPGKLSRYHFSPYPLPSWLWLICSKKNWRC